MNPRHRFCRIHGTSLGPCPKCEDFRRVPRLEFQHYWRCAHYPSAIDNFFDGRTACEWGCHAQALRSHHSGVHPMPRSWGSVHGADHARRGMGTVADQIFGV